MSVLTIECYNYKQHRNTKIVLNGKSAILMGDIKKGKSNIMKLILAHTNQAPYPSNPLSYDEKEGFTKTTHLAENGKVYTIQRKFSRDDEGNEVIDRMWVYPPSGPRGSLESMVEDVFNGAFKNGYFDYIEYFYKNKSSVTRAAYFIKAIGGAEIENNVTQISKLERERGLLGTQKDQKYAIFTAIDYNPETFEADLEYYSKDKTIQDCEKAKQEYLAANLKSKDDLLKISDTQMQLHFDVKKVEYTVANIDVNISNIEAQLKQLTDLRAEKQIEIKKIKEGLLPAKKFDKVVTDIVKIDDHNGIAKIKADEIYTEELTKLVEFKTNKDKFNNGLTAFEEYQEIDTKWNELDEKIKAKKLENEHIFRSRIPLPELTIGETKRVVKGEEIIEPVILYKGKEFSEDNLSTGERLSITSAIQMALNPEGGNFIVIPEAQSLGSEKAAVIEELEKHGIQYLIEMTIPDEDFKVEIIEHSITPKVDEVPVRKSRKK